MPQEYEVTSFKPSDFKDNFNNTWCDMAVMGFGEPVKIVLKDPSTVKVGDKLFGTINETTSKQGKTYYKFKKEQRPDYEQRQEKSDEYWAEKNDQIKAQWAIGQAVQLAIAANPAETTESFIEGRAKDLFAMVDRVSGKEAASEEKDAKAVADMVDYGNTINLQDVPL